MNKISLPINIKVATGARITCQGLNRLIAQSPKLADCY